MNDRTDINEATNAAAPLLFVWGVTKTFNGRSGPVNALKEVSFSVARGEFVALVGPSGCGKSTLLSIVAGLESATSGRIALAGNVITEPGPDRGMVFQRDNLFPWLTVRENVRFSRRLKSIRRALQGDRRRTFEARCEQLIDIVGLKQFAGAYPHELSGGMRQRAALARALANQPEVLLMDEPFGALDAQTREEMQEMLARLSERQGTTTLFVTHDVEEAVLLADRILVLAAHPGRIAKEVRVDLPRPRTLEMRLEPAFAKVRAEVLGSLYTRQRRSLSETALAAMVG
ncbi:MAG TPA: ABC transporter ATP-binding protein [Tepidisphaeraceae bacterium]|nr:ABC transporter ATP-binding protein [Tepidisphaeraceae bacterium]